MLQAQRIHERTTIAVPVRFEGPTGWLEGTARNISIGGLYVETKTPLPFETKCNLVLYTGGSEVPVTARVRWVDASGMGIQFLEMGARETHAIVKLMGG